MTVTDNKAAQALTTLSKAEEFLAKKGWAKGTLYTSDGRICLYRAVQLADGPGEQEAIRIILGCTGSSSIPIWNDAKERTFDDVKTVLACAKVIAQELAE